MKKKFKENPGFTLSRSSLQYLFNLYFKLLLPQNL